MPLIETDDYRPPLWLPNGHAQSIYPALWRSVPDVAFRRSRLATPDDDFLDLDWKTHAPEPTRPLVILSHGLEGNTHTQYIRGMVRHLFAHGYDCLAWNFRSCSGQMNRQLRFYHSGATEDLDLVIKYAVGLGYGAISLIGFSLGGNLTLKYLGEQQQNLPGAVGRAVVFSVPLHLSSGSRHLERWQARIYTLRFNRSLKRKIREKAGLLPGQLDVLSLRGIRTLRQFDDRYTSQLHGFTDAEDYYEKNSSLYFLPGIGIPTLLVNAFNDPFLSPECFPHAVARQLPNVFLQTPRQGGHCGFYPRRYRGVLWSEERAVAFLKENFPKK